MYEKPNKSLFRFADFNKRLGYESRLARAFESLEYAVERTEDAGEEVELIVNEILYGESKASCGS
jgi:hypothetical protein